MSKIKPTRADGAVKFNGFTGIGQKTPFGKGCADMCNLRIEQDGSLIPRTGYRRLFSFPGERIRGFWDGTLEGKYHCFVAAGARIYLLNLDNSTKTFAASLPSGKEDVIFLYYEEMLYLLTGESILVYSTEDKRFSEALPYIPLYGVNWDPVGMGSVNEDFNLLTPSIRIHYSNIGGATEFHLPFYAKSVERVRAGGVITNDFTLSTMRNRVTVPGGASGMEVEISFTVDLQWETREALTKAKAGFVQCGTQYDRLFLSGNHSNACVYPSFRVSESMLAHCRALIPGSMPLYFCADDVLYLGNREDPVNCFFSHRGRVFAFTEHEGWMLFEEDGHINALHATEHIGTTGPGAAARCGESMAIAGADGLYVLSSLPSQPEDLSFKHILYPMGMPDGRQLIQNVLLYWHGDRSELWICDKTDAMGSVWIWNTLLQTWYRFDNIFAASFCRMAVGECFGTADGSVYLFDPTLHTDAGGKIMLRWCSGPIDFNMSDMTRRALRISFSGDLGGESATLTVTRDGMTQTRTLTGNAGGGMEHFDLRFPLQRHRLIELSLSMPATPGAHLYKLSGYTKI